MKPRKLIAFVMLSLLFLNVIVPLSRAKGDTISKEQFDFEFELEENETKSRKLKFSTGNYYDIEFNSSEKIDVYIISWNNLNKSNFDEAEHHNKIKRKNFDWHKPDDDKIYFFVVRNEENDTVYGDVHAEENFSIDIPPENVIKYDPYKGILIIIPIFGFLICVWIWFIVSRYDF